MPGIHFHRSNRLEKLAAALAEVLESPLRLPLTPEVVVVQSLGMRRWIQLELARRCGVTMNIAFPFPGELTDRVLRATVPGKTVADAFSREVLPWRILGLFPRLLSEPAFASLLAYTSGEMGALKESQLAHRIAGLFDRYLAYRPELLLEWQNAKASDDWQPRLWRELIRGHRETHPPALAARAITALREGSFAARDLPERVNVFGISSLPPIYLEILNVLGTAAEVHLFLLEPTADYWADLLTPRERERELRRARLRDLPEDDIPDLRNRLLASLCKTGRDFSWLLLDRIAAATDDEQFDPPTVGTLLGEVQSDLYLQSESSTPRAIADDDRSLQIHCCHSPTRELEVLHDHLLALFAERPDLRPHDILVTMPDVETYAPFIDAVFHSPECEAQRIPYTIADRAARTENRAAAALLQVLDLVGGRFPAPAVLALLDTPAIRERFELTEGHLPLIREWVERSGIRWGIDAVHRASLLFTSFTENTWRSGLDRLLLGYALPGDGATLFGGLLPEPAVEGQAATVLGNFVEFTEQLFAHCAALASPRSPSAWEQSLRAAVSALFHAADEHADDLRRVHAVLESFAAANAAAGFTDPLEFAVVRAHLAAALTDDSSSSGFLAGRVTFCALKPMRSIPFRVICMLGLNDDAFPRRDRALGFDLIAQKPRRGDRSVRDDDRYLFLEALFSARETLYLSYCGLSPRDNSESPPSVIVAELLDYLARQFVLPGDFVLKHRLQPFSAAYFSGEDPRLFSYSADQAAAAQQRVSTRTTPPAFASTPLPPPGPEWHEVSLDQLAALLTHPPRYFLRERLRLRLPEAQQPPVDTEPSALDGLTRYELREILLRRSLAAGRLAADLEVARAAGRLPPHYAGASEFGALAAEVGSLLDRLGDALDAAQLPALAVHFAAGDWRLLGLLSDVRPQGLIRYRAAHATARDELRAWVSHLALQLTDAPRPITTFHAIDTSFRFHPVPDAAAHLRTLLEVYARSLQSPLPHFPESAREYVARKITQRGTKEPLAAARDVFSSREATDAWTQLAFRGVEDPLAGDFVATAELIWTPLLRAREVLK